MSQQQILSSQVSDLATAVAANVPTASTSVLGGVKVDGTTITISSGTISSSGAGYTLPTATTSVLGGVKVDGTTITISSGVISGSAAGLLAQNNTWTKAQRGAYTSLTSTSNSIAIDLSLSNNFNHSLTENTTLAAPSNAVAGQSGIIQFTNNASSAKTLAVNSFWKWPGGVSSTLLTPTTSAVDVMSYVVAASGAFAICTMANTIT